MGKAMTIAGMIVAVFVFAIFVLDLLTSFPFGTGMNAMHIGAIIASAILGYVSFSTFREQK
jgi:hypothetical protein